jgi:hypothetical protein
MSEADLRRFWRGALDAYVDYWRAVGRLSATYLRALSGAAGLDRRPGQAPPAAGEPATPAATRPAPATMALEGELGATAVGMFVVENSGSDRISGELTVPSLADPEGREARPQVAFDPERVTLEPGEQTVVQASIAIDKSLRTGRDYRGEVRVPGLAGTTVPIVVRRLAAASRPRSAAAPRRARG